MRQADCVPYGIDPLVPLPRVLCQKGITRTNAADHLSQRRYTTGVSVSTERYSPHPSSHSKSSSDCRKAISKYSHKYHIYFLSFFRLTSKAKCDFLEVAGPDITDVAQVETTLFLQKCCVPDDIGGLQMVSANV